MIFTQEFNAVPIRDTLAAARGSTITWTSPVLGVAAPVPNRPPGSDRAICRTVNGFLAVNVRNTAFLSDSGIAIVAQLVGDQNGISGIIASQVVQLGNQGNAYLFLTGNRIGYNQFSSFANLAQSIYLKLIIYRNGEQAVADDDIDLTVTGAMLGADPVA
jgi:hypothetical protein